MKKRIIIGLLGIGLLACDNDTIQHEELFIDSSNTLNIYETKLNTPNNISLSMDAVLSDSRCPEGAMCIWAGNAKARYLLSVNGSNDTIILNTHQGPEFPSDTTLHGYTFNLEEISPYPHIDKSIEYINYSSRVTISKE